MAKTFISYPSTIYGHLLAAIVGRYIKKEKPNESIQYWPNLTIPSAKDRRDMTLPLHIGARDSIYIVGQTPGPSVMEKLIFTLSPRYVAWYDNDLTVENKVYEWQGFPEDFNPRDIPGIRTDRYDLGVRLWKELFPNEEVPPCVRWIDDYYSGTANTTARAFVHGLKLLETCPKKLELEPDFLETGDIENKHDGDTNTIADNVWDACFEVKKPANFDSPDYNPEQEMNRMTWDATFQIMNMGSIVDTLVRLTTQELIEQDKFRHLTLEDGTKILLTNARECDPEVIRYMYTKTGATAKYAGWYYLELGAKPKYILHIVRLPEGESCIELAKKFSHPTGNDDFATFEVESLEYADNRSY